MKLVLDLHTHSGYAGGAGEKNLERAAQAAKLKGIDVLGTGDCLYPKWIEELKEQLKEDEKGLLTLRNRISKIRFLLQTELIFTLPQITNPKKSQVWHAIFLFPNFNTIEKTLKLFDKWQVQNTIGRPFIKNRDIRELQGRIWAILDTDPSTEIILAHIFTNNGFFGYKSRNNHLVNTFGKKLSERIKLIETGLSADPEMLNLVPELSNKVWVSFSDSHSDALFRIGRELTVIEAEGSNYQNIIKSLRQGKVIETVEFDPKEGKFYLTGHRDTKQHHKKGEVCIYNPSETPLSRHCPVCGKPLTIGVLERVEELSKIQKYSQKQQTQKRNYRHLVPLVDLIPGKNRETYLNIIEPFGSEYHLWNKTPEKIEKKLTGKVEDNIIAKILAVKKGNFTFDPPGFDGVYGKFKLI